MIIDIIIVMFSISFYKKKVYLKKNYFQNLAKKHKKRTSSIKEFI